MLSRAFVRYHVRRTSLASSSARRPAPMHMHMQLQVVLLDIDVDAHDDFWFHPTKN